MQTPSCQFYSSAASSCHRRPTTHYYGSVERGPMWLCVNKHLKAQDNRDREMREQEMDAILREKMMADGILLQQITEEALNMLEPITYGTGIACEVCSPLEDTCWYCGGAGVVDASYIDENGEPVSDGEPCPEC